MKHRGREADVDVVSDVDNLNGEPRRRAGVLWIVALVLMVPAAAYALVQEQLLSVGLLALRSSLSNCACGARAIGD
jgi:hypothetical protein